MQRKIFNDAVGELETQSALLVTLMKAAVEHGPTGNLANSIRKEPGKKKTVVVIKAGGASTTRHARDGKSYDYARAVEFGTEHVSAQPFFFPTFRLMRKKLRSSMRNKITKRIKEYSAE
jgi:HK97 gp10 family phage protein